MQTSVLIIDPQYLTRSGLFHLLDNTDNLSIEMSEDVNPEEAYAPYDVIIADYLEPYSTDVKTGFRQELLEKYTPKLLIISADRNSSRIKDLISLGVPGYLTKDCTPDEILSAIEMISKGNRFYCNKILDIVMEQSVEEEEENCAPTDLSPREYEVLQLITKGQTTTKIADNLHVSVHTINSHRKSILKKLNLKTLK